MEKFEIVHGADNIEKFDNILTETDRYIKILSKQNYFDLNAEVISDMLKKEIKVFQVSDGSAEFSKRRTRQGEANTHKGRYNTEGTFERKTAKHIPLLTCVSEKSACLALFNESGTFDPETILWSRDQKFRSWCNGFFDYFWNSV